MKNKLEKYQELVSKRKKCIKCNKFGFVNQSETKYDSCEIGNWTTWANSLNADIVIIGQDFADKKTFERDFGKIEVNDLKKESTAKDYTTVTNFNLRELSKIIGYDIGLPTGNSKENIFLTNAVLCLKNGKMNSSISNKALHNCSIEFLAPLINLISPKVIITLGSTATKATIFTFKNEIENSKKLIQEKFSDVFSKSPIKISNTEILIFPVYHPGRLGQANRQRIDYKKRNGFELQKMDWLKIKKEILK